MNQPRALSRLEEAAAVRSNRDRRPLSIPARSRAVWGAAAVLLCLGAGSALAAPKAVIVEPMQQNAGEVEPDRVLQYNYTLRNAGDTPLSISDLKPTCYCTTAHADALEVPAGGSTVVHVQIDPSDFTGAIQKGVEISTNDPANPTLLVQVDLKVRPGIAVVPPELDFGPIAAEGAKAREIDLKSPRERPFKVKTVTADSKFLSVQQEPFDSEEKSGVKLWVKVLPGVPAGPFASKVVLETDDAARPRIEVPVHGSGPGGVRVEPAKLRFQSAAPGAEVGTFVVSMGAAQIGSVHASTPQVEAKLEPLQNGSSRVRVTLASNAKPGTLMAKVLVTPKDKAQPEISVPVMGLVR